MLMKDMPEAKVTCCPTLSLTPRSFQKLESLSYLQPTLAMFDSPGAAPIAVTNIHADRTLAVFLRQEVEQRRGKADLLSSVADSLILFALSDTNPDEGKSREEVLQEVEEALPSAKQYRRLRTYPSAEALGRLLSRSIRRSASFFRQLHKRAEEALQVHIGPGAQPSLQVGLRLIGEGSKLQRQS